MILYSSLLLISSSLFFSKQVPFHSEPVSLPLIPSSLHLVHKSRLDSGGFSAMLVAKDCKSAVFFSDYSQVKNLKKFNQEVERSKWFRVGLEHQPSGLVSKVNFQTSGQLKDLAGEVLPGAAEAIDRYKQGYVLTKDDSGDVWYYSSLTEPPTILYKQSNYESNNSGLETVAVLPSSDILTIWEKRAYRDSHANASLILSSGQKIQLKYPAKANPKDATVLENGDLIVLEKDWYGKKGSRLRLVHIDSQHLLHRREFKQTVLFDHISVLYDNFEAMDDCKMNSKQWLYIVSDDNGDWLTADVEDKGWSRQRTLLLNLDIDVLMEKAGISKH